MKLTLKHLTKAFPARNKKDPTPVVAVKNFSLDVYGKLMKTELLQFIREEQKFNSIDELKSAILNDVKLLDA